MSLASLVERFLPRIYRLLVLLGLDHLLEFKSPIRLMLFISCIISLTFCIAWFLDVVQMTCFAYLPWTMKGIGRHTCLVHLFGAVVMFFMCQTSGMVLAYYDEEGEELCKRKEQTLGELEKQTTAVLERATGKARKLCGLLSADLGLKVREHIARMRKILEELRRTDSSSQGRRVYETLLTQMSLHLHRLRQPALDNFQKLVSLSDRSSFLTFELKRMKQQSMVEVLSGLSGPDRPVRTETAAGEIKSGLSLDFFESLSSSWYLPNFARDLFCSDARQPVLNRINTVDERLGMPTERDLYEELQDIPVELCWKEPERVVLRPLRMVLKWLERIKPTASARPNSRLRRGATTYSNPVDQLTRVIWHLRKSAFYRSILVGIVLAFCLFVFDFQVLLSILGVFGTGECSGTMIFQCTVSLLKQVLNIIAMSCFMVSLAVVLWNVERLDNVLKVQEEIEALEGFKRQVDLLNAHDLREDEDSSISMIQMIEAQLTDQNRIIASFFNEGWGQKVTLASYVQLASNLEQALRRLLVVQSPASDELGDEETGALLGSSGER